mmetsp:Transcript_46383/g.100639  ORF Transcript_46383/g.100639 Transcript_46383/m.100639 type:complete len:270 (-) Transcript_46383:101-910(-)
MLLGRSGKVEFTMDAECPRVVDGAVWLAENANVAMSSEGEEAVTSIRIQLDLLPSDLDFAVLLTHVQGDVPDGLPAHAVRCVATDEARGGGTVGRWQALWEDVGTDTPIALAMCILVKRRWKWTLHPEAQSLVTSPNAPGFSQQVLAAVATAMSQADAMTNSTQRGKLVAPAVVEELASVAAIVADASMPPQLVAKPPEPPRILLDELNGVAPALQVDPKSVLVLVFNLDRRWICWMERLETKAMRLWRRNVVVCVAPLCPRKTPSQKS